MLDATLLESHTAPGSNYQDTLAYTTVLGTTPDRSINRLQCCDYIMGPNSPLPDTHCSKCTIRSMCTVSTYLQTCHILLQTMWKIVVGYWSNATVLCAVKFCWNGAHIFIRCPFERATNIEFRNGATGRIQRRTWSAANAGLELPETST